MMRSFLRKITPEAVKNVVRKIKLLINPHLELYQIARQANLHKNCLKKLKNKKRVRVAFFITHSSVWKYDGVFKLMLEDSRFDPKVVICPVINYGRENMTVEMDKAYSHFKEKGYQPTKGYDASTNNFLDVKKIINPDIIFFTNPHNIVVKNFCVTNFMNLLSCYVPYNLNVTCMFEEQNDLLFHNVLWKAFYETSIHLDIARKSRNKGANVVITGFPGVDDLIYGKRTETPAWKEYVSTAKRIIWAPHHSIGKNGVTYSNFLLYGDLFRLIAQRYQGRVQLAFKPHPLLKVKLYNHPLWGKEKTDEYYRWWQEGENTQLETDTYIDLFNGSDAMILDSCSFTAEYLYCGKPSLFTMLDSDMPSRFNEFGKMALTQHYHAYSEEDIINFIDKVILDGDDYMKDQRDVFFKEYLLPPNGNTASENIFNCICKELFD
nr:CDP-glycerol glycerophosphotransferase family protein [uncultured Dethiosulfovibrio sp.]